MNRYRLNSSAGSNGAVRASSPSAEGAFAGHRAPREPTLADCCEEELLMLLIMEPGMEKPPGVTWPRWQRVLEMQQRYEHYPRD